MAHRLVTSQASSLLAPHHVHRKTVHTGALVSKVDFTEGFVGGQEGAHLHGTPGVKTTCSVLGREACPPRPLSLTASLCL